MTGKKVIVPHREIDRKVIHWKWEIEIDRMGKGERKKESGSERKTKVNHTDIVRNLIYMPFRCFIYGKKERIRRRKKYSTLFSPFGKPQYCKPHGHSVIK